MRLKLAVAVAFVTLVFADSTRAQAPSPCLGTGGCDTAPFVQSYQTSGLSTVDFDSGWLPGGSPLQVRATLHIGGQSKVRLNATEGVFYPPMVRVAFDGQSGGYVSIDYGIEVHFYFRFNVLGVGWDGEIPIPGIPDDLRLASNVAIDDLVLTGATPRPVVASDVTDRIRVLTYDLGAFLGGLVSGGAALDVQAMLSATYDSQRILVDRALVPITTETGVTTIYPTTGSDYGGSMNVVAHAEGRIAHVGTVHLFPAVFISVLGQGFSVDIADIPFNLVKSTKNIVFPDVTNIVPLPDLRVDEARVEYGELAFGTEATKPLVVHNDGSAPLEVEVVLTSSIFGLSRVGVFTIPARGSFDLAPTFHAMGLGEYSQTVLIRANDPDLSMRSVTLSGSVSSFGPLDGGVGGLSDGGLDDGGVRAAPALGGCGCSVVGGGETPSFVTLGALGMIGLATVLGARRRARASRRSRS